MVTKTSEDPSLGSDDHQYATSDADCLLHIVCMIQSFEKQSTEFQ